MPVGPFLAYYYGMFLFARVSQGGYVPAAGDVRLSLGRLFPGSCSYSSVVDHIFRSGRFPLCRIVVATSSAAALKAAVRGLLKFSFLRWVWYHRWRVEMKFLVYLFLDAEWRLPLLDRGSPRLHRLKVYSY